jgi:NAD(P)-dependent dehydrogenase (short-subunit alcohol dehydrogenase family)
MRTVLVTNATQYTGPGAVEILLRQGMRVLCHDRSFDMESARNAFSQQYPQAECLLQAEPEPLVAELRERGIELDALVSNDVYPITNNPIGAIPLDDLRNAFDAVVAFPVQLTQLLLPAMKTRGRGCFVFVTSARPLQPEAGFAVPTSVRAAATTFALCLARETASSGIQVNIVAPNYLYSEMYYPRARFIDDPQGRQHIADTVPAGRLGTPQEAGELIAFLASGRSPFVTGQVIHFTGGWP